MSNRENKIKKLGKLHDNEIDLLLIIRKKYKYGEITIQTHDGLPRYVKKTVERTKLGDD